MQDLNYSLRNIKRLYLIFDVKRKYQVIYILLINIFNGILEYLTLLAVSIFKFIITLDL